MKILNKYHLIDNYQVHTAYYHHNMQGARNKATTTSLKVDMSCIPNFYEKVGVRFSVELLLNFHIHMRTVSELHERILV